MSEIGLELSEIELNYVNLDGIEWNWIELNDLDWIKWNCIELTEIGWN